MSPTPESVDTYLTALPDEQRGMLEEVRKLIASIAPDAVESISYGLPTFKYHGKPLVYFGAAKNHWALYGAGGDAYPELLAGYETSKGTIRFPWDEPIPADIVNTVVSDRLAKIDASAPKAKQRAVKSDETV